MIAWANRWRYTLIAAAWTTVNVIVALLHSQGGLW